MSFPLIGSNNVAGLLAILFALVGIGFGADAHSVLRRISGTVCVIVGGLLLSNLFVIPRSAPTYDFIFQFAMPFGIPLLLFKADMRKILREGRLILPMFLIGSVTIALGAILGFFAFALGDAGAKVAGVYAGAWIGGMVSFAAVAEATGLTADQFSIFLSASAPVSILALTVLATLPSLGFVRRWFPDRMGETRSLADELSHPKALPSFNLVHVASACALSATICAIAGLISNHWNIHNYHIFLISLMALVLANVAPRWVGRLDGDFELGMLVMFLYFAAAGASTDATAFLDKALILFFYGLIVILFHFLVFFLLAKLFRIDFPTALIASAANVVGAAPTAALASAQGWRDLVAPGLAAGILGKVLGTFIGIAIYKLLA